jgi:hypothetical protein
MTNAYDMVNVAQGEFQQLVSENASCIPKTKQAMICKDSSQAHGPRMQYSFVAQAAETGVAMDNFDTLADHDIAEDGEEGEDSRKRRLPVDDQERYVVDFEAIGQVSYTCSAGICMSDDDHLMAAVDEFLYIVRNVQDNGRRVLRSRADTCDFPPLLFLIR